MQKQELIEKWQKIGKYWLGGDLIGIDFGKGKKIEFLPPQKKFIDAQNYHSLYYGGFGSGKTLGLLIKAILYCLCFAGNRVLLGRQYLADIEKILLPDLFEILPSSYYHYRVKDGIIRFFNSSEMILFGLDALQTGPLAEIKKAQQKLKGLNLGAYFIDQLEEVEYEVFDILNTRLRRQDIPFVSGNMTCNPANFWAYRYFIENQVLTEQGWIPSNKKKDVCLVQGSLFDNEKHLRPEYIQRQLEGHSEEWVKRFIYGKWSKDILIPETVFDKADIQRWQVKKPITESGCQIWEHYKKGLRYQMGVDVSTGSVDPSSITVASNEGKKVAKYRGFVPINALVDKVRFLYQKYRHPLIVPEINGPGYALIENIKDLRIYQRIVFDRRENQETKKLGWKTDASTKPILIADFKNKIQDIQIFDSNTVEEFKTFVWSDEARQKGAGAEKGFHDDDLISTLLAFYKLKIIKPSLRQDIQKLIKEGIIKEIKGRVMDQMI